MTRLPKLTQPKPWDMAKRTKVKARIDKEAARAAERLGAHTVLIVATFSDGDFLHMQDGGTSPMPKEDLYVRMQTMHQAVEASDGQDTIIQ